MEKRIEQTYTKFFKGLCKLLKQKSFEDISISEICDASNVKRPTFYNHFEDKEDFVIKIIRYLYTNSPSNLNDIQDYKEFCKEFTFYCLKIIEKIRSPKVAEQNKIETSKLYFLCFQEIHKFLYKKYETRKYKDLPDSEQNFFIYRMSSRLLAFLIFFYNSEITFEEMKKHINQTINFHYI